MSLQKVLIVLAFALTGCASAPTQSAAERRCDSAMMAAVERAAWNQKVQVDVIWVNPPRSRHCAAIAL